MGKVLHDDQDIQHTSLEITKKQQGTTNTAYITNIKIAKTTPVEVKSELLTPRKPKLHEETEIISLLDEDDNDSPPR